MILHDKGIIPNQPLAHFSLLDFPTIGLTAFFQLLAYTVFCKTLNPINEEGEG